MGSSGFARWAPLGGIVFVVLWVVTFIVIGNDVDTQDSDAKILSYYADSGHQHKHVASLFLFLAASAFFLWFLVVLRGRLAQAEGGAGVWTAAAFGAGLVSTALWTVGGAFFALPGIAFTDTSKFHLDPNSYRLVEDVGYVIWFSGTTIALIVIVATSVLGLRAGAVPKWLAWLGFVAAATLLVSIFFLPFFVLLGWVLVVSIVFLVRPERREVPQAA